jgi:hypothetical protein
MRAARSMTPSASDAARKSAAKLANDLSNSLSFVHMGTASDSRLL